MLFTVGVSELECLSIGIFLCFNQRDGRPTLRVHGDAYVPTEDDEEEVDDETEDEDEFNGREQRWRQEEEKRLKENSKGRQEGSAASSPSAIRQ